MEELQYIVSALGCVVILIIAWIGISYWFFPDGDD